MYSEWKHRLPKISLKIGYLTSVAVFPVPPQLCTGMQIKGIRTTVTSLRHKNEQQQKSQLKSNNLFSSLKTTTASLGGRILKSLSQILPHL